MPRVDLAVTQEKDASLRPLVRPAELSREVLSLNPNEITREPNTDVRLGAPTSNEDKLIKELAASMKIKQAQPVLVRRETFGYSIIAGRRRLAAAVVAGIRVDAVAIDCDDDTARRLAFEENYRRKQMSPIEFALNIKAYRDRITDGMSPDAGKVTSIARYFQVSPAQITQMEKLLVLPQDIQDQVHAGALAVDAAFTLAKVVPEAREDVMKIAVEKAKQDVPKPKAKKNKPERVPPTPEQKNVFKAVKEAATHDREEKAAVAKVQTKHVLAAARETETLQGRKIRNRNEILSGIESLGGPGVPEVMDKFIEFLVWEYANGNAANDTGLRNRWNDIAFIVESSVRTRATKTKATVKPKATRWNDIAKPKSSAKPKQKK